MRELLISDIQIAAFLVARGHELLETGVFETPDEVALAGRMRAVRLVRVGCGPRCRPACVRSLW